MSDKTAEHLNESEARHDQTVQQQEQIEALIVERDKFHGALICSNAAAKRRDERIAGLIVERDQARKQVAILNQAYWSVSPEHKEALARVASLEEALRPFAEAKDKLAKVEQWAKDNRTYTDWTLITCVDPTHWDRARAALSSTTPPQNAEPALSWNQLESMSKEPNEVLKNAFRRHSTPEQAGSPSNPPSSVEAEANRELARGHDYPGCRDPKDFWTSDCANGCGCWMGDSRSGGPDGINPFGECPQAPLPTPPPLKEGAQRSKGLPDKELPSTPENGSTDPRPRR